MKAAVVVLALAGCGTTWLVTQATGTQRAWDEQVREETVPLPGVTEHLSIELPLAIDYEQIEVPGVNGAAPTYRNGDARPFALSCRVAQDGKNAVYHAAFRYGSRWGKEAGIAFLVEAGLGALLLGTASAAHPNGYFYGGFFALDALVTGAIFFIPRREIYREDDAPATTAIRSDCPDGLALDIGGEPFPVDAAGKIGDVAEQALAEWMAAPKGGALRATFGGQSADLVVGVDEQCAWQRGHDPKTACTGGLARSTSARFTLAAGTLTVP